jgi:hypothetical protein
MLLVGVEEYDREGNKYMQRVLNSPGSEDHSQS